MSDLSLTSDYKISGVATNSLSNKEFIGETPLTKAKIFINPKGNAGKFLCSHVMRICTELKISHPDLLTGFIHIPQYSDFRQLAEVLSITVEQFIAKKIKTFQRTNEQINIMFTGFTRFGKVDDNSSARFLFSDGVSDNIESFGFKNPDKENLSNIFNLLSLKTEDYSFDDKTIKFNYQNKKINLFFVRLPVDDKFNNSDSNYQDTAGNILKNCLEEVNPDIIISLGVGIYDKTDEYNIEINAKGMTYGKYQTKEFIPNYDLCLIFKDYFNKEIICQQ